LKGWEFANGTRLVCSYIDGYYFALQGECPRCAFDLWKGDLIITDDAWEDLPRVACPTCSTTYSMRTGMYGPPLKRTGLQAFVSGLAKSATSQQVNRNAKSYKIIVDCDGKIFCREP
jgi:nitrite reductase/ring-hydroxylating ferredoxin subunit